MAFGTMISINARIILVLEQPEIGALLNTPRIISLWVKTQANNILQQSEHDGTGWFPGYEA